MKKFITFLIFLIGFWFLPFSSSGQGGLLSMDFTTNYSGHQYNDRPYDFLVITKQTDKHPEFILNNFVNDLNQVGTAIGMGVCLKNNLHVGMLLGVLFDKPKIMSRLPIVESAYIGFENKYIKFNSLVRFTESYKTYYQYYEYHNQAVIDINMQSELLFKMVDFENFCLFLGTAQYGKSIGPQINVGFGDFGLKIVPLYDTQEHRYSTVNLGFFYNPN